MLREDAHGEAAGLLAACMPTEAIRDHAEGERLRVRVVSDAKREDARAVLVLLARSRRAGVRCQHGDQACAAREERRLCRARHNAVQARSLCEDVLGFLRLAARGFGWAVSALFLLAALVHEEVAGEHVSAAFLAEAVGCGVGAMLGATGPAALVALEVIDAIDIFGVGGIWDGGEDLFDTIAAADDDAFRERPGQRIAMRASKLIQRGHVSGLGSGENAVK